EVLDDDVAPASEIEHDGTRLGLGEIQRDAALADVDAHEVRRLVLAPGLELDVAAAGVVALAPLDLEDVGAEVGEQARAVRAPKLQFAAATPTVAVLDGDHGFGQVVARRGTTRAIERGRVHGLAAVALRRTSHVGRLADYAEAMAAAGLVGMLWANAKSGLNV